MHFGFRDYDRLFCVGFFEFKTSQRFRRFMRRFFPHW